MLPIHAPNQIMPDTIIFLLCPPVLEVMSESEMTKLAW